MKTIKYLAPLILLVAITSSPLAAPAANPFAGTWAGTVDGTQLTLIISESGTIKGTYSAFWAIPVRGQISDDGILSVKGRKSVHDFDNFRNVWTLTVQIQGVVAIDEYGHMVGIVEVGGDLHIRNGIFVLDLAPQG